MKRYVIHLLTVTLFLLLPHQVTAQFSNARLIYESEINHPSDVALIDVDGDGRKDVLVVSRLNEEFSWYRNLGEGEFGEQQLIADTELPPRRLYSSDVDMDGDQDVILLKSRSYSDPNIVWYENQQDGFSLPSAISVGDGSAQSVQLADLDGDGDEDLVYEQNETVAWNANLGGRFSTQNIISDQLSNINSLEVVDVDGDQRQDIIIAHEKDSRISEGQLLWYQNRDSTFGEPQVLLDSIGTAHDLHAVQKENGKMKVFASVDSPDHRRYILEMVNVQDSLTQADTLRHPTSEVFDIVDLMDINRDDQMDLLVKVFGSESLAWIEQTENGFKSIQFLGTSKVSGVKTADLSGNADKEIVFTSVKRDNVIWYGSADSSYAMQGALNVNTVSRPYQVGAADLDDDGDIDVISSSTDDHKLAWYPNNQTSFGEQKIISDSSAGRAFAIANLDGDSRKEIVSNTSASNLVSYDREQGIFNYSMIKKGTVDRAIDIETGDVDGDGDNDVISLDYSNEMVWYEHTEDGYILNPSNYIGQASSMELTDIDGGLPDLVAAESNGTSVTWYKGTSEGFGESQVISDTIAFGPQAVVADLDNDGTRDVFINGIVSDHMVYYLNNGTGEFRFGGKMEGIPGYNKMVHGDFTGNGYQDIGIGSQYGFHLYKNDSLSFTREEFSDRSITALEKADIDGDGKPDLIAGSERDDKIWWLENTYSSTSIAEPGPQRPGAFKLYENYPNPFNPTTNIQFSLPNASHVQITVYNTLGQQVATLMNRQISAGTHSVTFEASGLPSGVYIYRLKTGDFSQSRKMLLLK